MFLRELIMNSKWEIGCSSNSIHTRKNLLKNTRIITCAQVLWSLPNPKVSRSSILCIGYSKQGEATWCLSCFILEEIIGSNNCYTNRVTPPRWRMETSIGTRGYLKSKKHNPSFKRCQGIPYQVEEPTRGWSYLWKWKIHIKTQIFNNASRMNHFRRGWLVIYPN